jgi:hypothetical protein
LLLTSGMCRFIASALGAWLGCTDVTAPPDTTASVHVTLPDGQATEQVARKDDAYVAADELPGARDYFFRVVDEAGSELSQDPVQCRKVHVDESGLFDLVYDGSAAGTACKHPCTFTDDGGLALQLAPYAGSSSGTYRVEVSPSSDFAAAVSRAFDVSL